jgi:hypothetical protein
MVLEFEIIHINIHHNRGLFIFARRLGENHEIEVPEGAMLRDLPVYHYKEIQPKDENGNPRKDIFVFQPMNVERLFDKSFKVGDVVTLVLPE